MSEQHSKINSYTTTRLPMLEHYVGVNDYGPGYVPRLANTGSEKSPLGLHFLFLHRDTQIGSCTKTVGQHHGDKKEP